jgi:hypothetical protein
MRQPEDLSRPELVELVTRLQQALYQGFDAEHKAVWNADHVWDAPEICDELAQLLVDLKLAPDMNNSDLFTLFPPHR